MDTITAIEGRRSIRKFTNAKIDDNTLSKIIKSGILAPSSKNSQPWRFKIIEGEKKDRLLVTFNEQLKRKEKFLKILGSPWIGTVKNSIQIMERTPVLVFIFEHRSSNQSILKLSSFWQRSTYQSIGAAIENMILTATSLGIGSLWICDVLFLQKECKKYFQTSDDLMAVIAFGYADEEPNSRPRKSYSEIVEYCR
ncbi:MAG: nitroreductase [Candidatus Babeliaceae bacterium]|nr:nitroreductase [Candidatus Babeliaceae bacterium]